MTAAAALVVLVFGATAVWRRSLTTDPGSFVPPVREYVSRPGQRVTVTLPDGTQFTLAPDSKIRLAPGYGMSRRELELEGQAYFTVTHDAQHPFTVHAGNALARDVGTRFDMRAYPEDHAVQVVVAEGAVALHPMGILATGAARSAHELLLTARTLGVVDRAGNARAVPGLDVTPYLAWRDGELAFDDTPFRDVLRELERWYGVEISLDDEAIGARHVRATIRAESLTAALDLLAPSAGARYERHGATITVYPAPDGVPVRTRSSS